VGKTNSTSSQLLPRREIQEAMQSKVLERQGWRCAYCEVDLHAVGHHIDHKKPLCRGGTHHPNNLCGTCPKCNERKGGRMSAREYRAWLEECRNAPAGTWSCLNPGHEKYVGERWVPIPEFNKGDSWCRNCRSRYMKVRWQRVRASVNACQRERYLLDGAYRTRQLERSRENYYQNAEAINQARRERYHNDPEYRAQALARAQRQTERRGRACIEICSLQPPHNTYPFRLACPDQSGIPARLALARTYCTCKLSSPTATHRVGFQKRETNCPSRPAGFSRLLIAC